MMKTGLVSVTFRELPTQQVINLAARAGLDCIEWGGDIHVPTGDIERARDVGERTRAAGLEVACYGSYYRLMDHESGIEEQVIATAKALGAPMIRVWAGRLGSEDAWPEHRTMVRRNAQNLADLAAREGMEVVFEYHSGTLTDTADSALALLEAVDRPNVGTLWQPPVGMETAACVRSIERLGGHIRNIHVFSWYEDTRLGLNGCYSKWRECLRAIEAIPGEHRLMLEFVVDDDPDIFMQDAEILKEWARGARYM